MQSLLQEEGCLMPTLPAPQLHDKVTVLSTRHGQEHEQIGWVITLTDDLIRIADNPVDDGRPDADEDWWRKTFILSDVTVVVLS